MKHWLSPRPIQTVISKFLRAAFKRGCPVFPYPLLFSLVFPGGDGECVDITYRGLRSPPPLFPLPPIPGQGEGVLATLTPHPAEPGQEEDPKPGGAGEDVYIQEINYSAV